MAETVVSKRLFISGIAPSLSAAELAKRLKSYGSITTELELNSKNAHTTGIFAHCSLALDAAGWSRLRKLSGTVLKGSKLRIEEAKQDWTAWKGADDKRTQPVVPNPRKRPPVDTIPAIESKRVKRGEVVKDGSITQKSRKQGWIKGRYGRAIAILKTEDGVKLKRNPDALSRLWGSAHPTPDQLTYYYDDEEEEWHDRRGRVIRDIEIQKKRQPVEERHGGRVEIWHSDEEADDVASYTVASSSKPDDDSVATTSEMFQVNLEELEAQLQKERSTGLSLLGDMFKGHEVEEAARLERQAARKVRDKLDIVKRFDPTAPESESDAESELAADTNDAEDELRNESQIDLDHTTGEAAIRDYNGAEDEDVEEVLPNVLKSAHNNGLPENLTSIFQPRKEHEAAKFTLFQTDEEGDDEEEEVAEDEAATAERSANDPVAQHIHPDRLNRPELADLHHDEAEQNANFTALSKDRGFKHSNISSTPGVFPLLLAKLEDSSLRSVFAFFVDSLNVEEIKANWESKRGDATSDWKRKLREGTKKMRKASNRQH